MFFIDIVKFYQIPASILCCYFLHSFGSEQRHLQHTIFERDQKKIWTDTQEVYILLFFHGLQKWYETKVYADRVCEQLHLRRERGRAKPKRKVWKRIISMVQSQFRQRSIYLFSRLYFAQISLLSMRLCHINNKTFFSLCIVGCFRLVVALLRSHPLNERLMIQCKN